MSLLTRLFGKPEKEITTESGPKKPPPESTGTTLRPSADATRITKKKPGPELSALEIVDQQAWEIKTLPVWQPGDVILDTYEVEDVISGGMGHVYIANHNKWNVKLAIKSPNEMMLSDRDFFARILREANSWTELGLHPNIAYCYYVRNIENIPHIVVEYVDGGNLRQWIEDGKCIDYRLNLDLAIQFCHGIEHAHSKGMIHRDIKPENVLMTEDGVLKITDFGLVRGNGGTDIQSSHEQDVSNQPAGHGLTTVGTLMGTEGYMAPEQAESAGDVDERADIFSFGVCLYEMFCGNKPYDITYGPKQEAPDPQELSRDDKFPLELAEILKKSILWNRDDRYDSFTAIRRELTGVYEQLYREVSPHAEFELVGMEADGLNNQGVSFMELGNKEEAMRCWQEALEIEPDHLEAIFNQGLIMMRDGTLPAEILVRFENIANPAVNKERLAEYQALIHAENLDSASARRALAAIPGKYEEVFKDSVVGSHKVLKGHTGIVNSVSLTPDGRLGLSGGHDKTVRLWDLESGECLHIMEDHTERIESVCLTPDGRLGMSGGSDETIRLWDIETGECIRTMEGHKYVTTSVRPTPDGRLGLSGGWDKMVRLWDLETGECIRTMEGHTGHVNSVSLTPDGRLALSGGGEKDVTVRLWDLETGECLRTIDDETMLYVTSVSLTPDGRLGLSGSADKKVRLWDLGTGNCLQTMETGEDWVSSVSLSSDGRLGLSGGMDKTVRLWDLTNGRCLRLMTSHTDDVQSVSLTPDGCLGLSGDFDYTIRFWQFGTCKVDLQLCLPENYAGRIKTEKERNANLASAQALYNQNDFRRSWKMLHAAWQENGYGNDETILKLYNRLFRKGKRNGLLLLMEMERFIDLGYVGSVRLTPDGRWGISDGNDKTVRVWDLSTGECCQTMEGYKPVRLTSDARLGLSAEDKRIRVWDLGTGACIRTMEGHTKPIKSISLTPDGRLGLSGGGNDSLRVWDLGTGRCLQTMEDHAMEIVSVDMTPDGCLGLSGGLDGIVRLWDLAAGECLRTMVGHMKGVSSVNLTPDGRLGLSGSGDNTLCLWDLASGECLRTMTGHTMPVTSVSLTMDGQLGLSGSGDKTVRLWDLSTGECINTIEGHSDWVWSISLTPDGLLGMSGSSDSTIRLFRFIYDLAFEE